MAERSPTPAVLIPLVHGKVGEDSDIEDFGSRNYRPYNRGNKLKRLVEQPSHLPTKPTLWPIRHPDDEIEYIQVGNRRAIVRRTRRSLTDIRALYDDDPYSGIKMEEIWALPDKLSDLRLMEPVVRTLRNRQLNFISRVAMRFIEEEGQVYRALLELAGMLQGEDPATKDLEVKANVPADVVEDLEDTTDELLGFVNEYIDRLEMTRRKVLKAHLQKKTVYKKLK